MRMKQYVSSEFEQLPLKYLRDDDVLHVATGDPEHPIYNTYYDFVVTERGETPKGIIMVTCYPNAVTAMGAFILKEDIQLGGMVVGVVPERKDGEVILTDPIFQIEVDR